jgi:hypothetical protein
MGGIENGPSGFDYVEETRASDLPEDTSWIAGKAVGQLGPILPVERPAGIQVIGTVEYPADHVPLSESERVIANSVEHAPIILSLRSRSGRAGRPVPKLGRNWCISSPPRQLLGWRIV